jgi:hypothetical protein
MKLQYLLIGLYLLLSGCKRDDLIIAKPNTPLHDKIVFIKELNFDSRNSSSIVAANSQFLVLNTGWWYAGVSNSHITHTFFNEFLSETCHIDDMQFNANGVTASACECNGNIFCYNIDYLTVSILPVKGCSFEQKIFHIDNPGSPNNREINFMKITQKGNLVFQVPDSLYCMDSLGGMRWIIPTSPLNLTALRDVCETTSGDVLLLGEKQSPSTDRDFCVTRFDKNGTIVWQKLYGGIRYEEAQQMLYKNDGEIFLLGHSSSYSSNAMHDAFIVHINSDGDTLKQKTFGGVYHDGLQCGKLYMDKLVVSGYHDPDGSGKEQVFVTLLDKDLNVLQQEDAPFTGNYRPTSCALINNTFAVCGDQFVIRFTLPY